MITYCKYLGKPVVGSKKNAPSEDSIGIPELGGHCARVYGVVTVAGALSCVPSGSIVKPLINPWPCAPPSTGNMSSEIVIVRSDGRAAGGIERVSPLIVELASFTVMMPPVALGISAEATGLVANT